MANKKKILYPVVFMVILTAVYTFALAFVNEATIDTIKAQEELDVQKAILYTFDIEHDGSDEMVKKLYDEKLSYHAKDGEDDLAYYIYKDAGTVKGYAFYYTGKGLWGSISGYLAFDPNFESLLGIVFTAHSETPGLGGRIDEAWFKEQFRGLSIVEDDPIEFKPAASGTIDGITGATATSVAVKEIVNDFVKQAKDAAKEGLINE